MKIAVILTLLALIMLSGNARLNIKNEKEEAVLDEQHKDDTEFWFDQLSDHFNPADYTTFKQRYFDISQYWDPKTGPLILYICGEGTCRQPGDTSYVVKAAKEMKGRVFALEHRYYGKSHPVEDWSTENLRLLSADQGLADLANFGEQISRGLAKEHGIPMRRWIVVGGSYPGAMVSWFRQKFPHVAMGGLASSAVVNSIDDFFEFDEQIYNSTLKSGKECPEKLHNITEEVVAYFKKGESNLIKGMFNATEMPDDEFYFFLADVMVETVQYGKREVLCDKVTKTKDLFEILEWFAEWGPSNMADFRFYWTAYMNNHTIDHSKNMR